MNWCLINTSFAAESTVWENYTKIDGEINVQVWHLAFCVIQTNLVNSLHLFLAANVRPPVLYILLPVREDETTYTKLKHPR
jgi:hypothetical protein